MADLPRAGDVFRITKACSVQFLQPFRFRVIRVLDWHTYDGWMWLDGYQLNPAGDAVNRRSIFVMTRGLVKVTPPVVVQATKPRRPVQRSPQRVP
ncbi:hypothetical protein AB0B57_22390 [Micromonospora sp. NPDC049101]|uniref:hypothetical protein n=1 Tax=Micromonospora sp. NPDC049101 TaxID=3155032 RepID=UPI0033CE28E6